MHYFLAKTGYHGADGPMKVCDMQRTPLVEAFLNAGKQLGYDITDINASQQLGTVWAIIINCLFLVGLMSTCICF